VSLATGFLAVSAAPGTPLPDLARAADLIGAPTAPDPGIAGVHPAAGPGSAAGLGAGEVRVLLAGVAVQAAPGGARVALLSRGPRSGERDLDATTVAELLRSADAAGSTRPLAGLLPPFAALVWDRTGLVAGVDRLGFRHLYLRHGPGWAALSSSARALAALAPPSGLDPVAIGTQSLLGWQVGARTPFDGVRTVPPGALLRLAAGRSSVVEPEPAPAPADVSVAAAADLLRTYLGGYLDDHPDAVLQLTGGQDSRILLGAIPAARRRGLTVMTLAVPGSPDLAIAAGLARRYGLRHQVVDLGGLAALDPAEAHALAVGAARRLECSADPLAFASVAWAEAKTDARPRLAGLGGEVARGFYYLGPVRSVRVTDARVRRLAEWRMFPNEAVSAATVDAGFAATARERTLAELTGIFVAAGPDWLRATDGFYLGQRMRRWAGVLASADCLDRTVVNPMLDPRFLDLVGALPPRAKQGSRFLSRLSVALDPELSAIPMDARPAPAVYAHRSPANRARLAAVTGRKVLGKARQRLSRTGRPPAGGELLAARIAEFYRAEPSRLDAARAAGVFRPEWLDAVAAGTAAVDPASAAMLVTLEVATGDPARSAAGAVTA
jgi:asparagine synthase (glutamine-hydrolysing)